MLHISFPISLTIGGQHLPLHPILETLGIFIAMRYYYYLKRNRQDVLTDYNRLVVLVATIFGAYFGSHIVGALENIPEWRQSPNFWLYLHGNKTIAGGMAGGLLLVEVVKKALKISTSTGDIYVYPLLLGLIIGRVGCFSMGIYEMTYGIPTHLFLGLNLGDGIPRHPVVLYEIVFLLLLWFGLKWVSKKYVLHNGALFKLLMIAYFAFRFLVEFLKPTYKYAMGLDAIQFLTIIIFVYYNKYLLHPRLLLKSSHTCP